MELCPLIYRQIKPLHLTSEKTQILLQCPPASFICLTVVNTRPDHPSEPPRILQVVPVASGDIRPKFRSTNTTTDADLLETHLQLTVHGLLNMKQKQRAVFHMQCVEVHWLFVLISLRSYPHLRVGMYQMHNSNSCTLGMGPTFSIGRRSTAVPE